MYVRSQGCISYLGTTVLSALPCRVPLCRKCTDHLIFLYLYSNGVCSSVQCCIRYQVPGTWYVLLMVSSVYRPQGIRRAPFPLFIDVHRFFPTLSRASRDRGWWFHYLKSRNPDLQRARVTFYRLDCPTPTLPRIRSIHYCSGGFSI